MHVAAAKLLMRIHGVEWRYMLFDYGNNLGVCGEYMHDGELHRQAVKFEVRKYPLKPGMAALSAILEANKEYVEQAKEMIIESLARGEGVVGDNVMEGNELTLETTK
jgi:hypothetical protein